MLPLRRGPSTLPDLLLLCLFCASSSYSSSSPGASLHFPSSLCTPAPPSSLSSPVTILYSRSREADPLPATLSLRTWVSGRFYSGPSWPATRPPHFASLPSCLALCIYAVPCPPSRGCCSWNGASANTLLLLSCSLNG